MASFCQAEKIPTPMPDEFENCSDEELLALENELEAKEIQFDCVQKSLKEILAGCYGAFAAKYFRFHDERLARSITVTGQMTVKTAENTVNDYMRRISGKPDMDFIIAMDTDSIYLGLDEFVTTFGKEYEAVTGKKLDTTDEVIDFIDAACENTITPQIEVAYADLSKKMNAFANKMVMKREVIASSAIWTAKKKYAMNVHDDEGLRYAKPKVKVVGLEVVRTSTPKVCRTKSKKPSRSS